MKTPTLKLIRFILIAWTISIVPSNQAYAAMEVSFQYLLSNFSGSVPSQWAKLVVDPSQNEVYVLNRRAKDIRIFDENGMEIYIFGEGFASAADIALGEDGNIFILDGSFRNSAIHLCNYRGERISEVKLTNIPDEFSNFVPDRLVFSQAHLYLIDSTRMIAIVAEADGRFKQGYMLKSLLRQLFDNDSDSGKLLKSIDDVDLNGFNVDKQGNMLFTVPTLFAAFILSANGELSGFGKSGSGPGKFGVVAGIVADDRGYIYVTDRLRSVVIVFDQNLEYKTEFGFRGSHQSSLVVPDDIDIDSKGNIYVAQAANRGVSVFKVTYE